MGKRKVLLSILSVALLLYALSTLITDGKNNKSQLLKVVEAKEKSKGKIVATIENVVYPLKQEENNFTTFEYIYTTIPGDYQAAYRKIVQEIEQHKDEDYQMVDFSERLLICEVDLSEYYMNEKQLVHCFWSVLADHTEYFFVSDSPYYYLNDNSKEMRLYIMASEEFGEKAIREAVYDKLNYVVEDITSNISGMDYTIEKIRYIDNYIRQYFTYAYDETSEPEVNDKTSTIAGILDGRVICAGYAKVNHFLCNQLGIKNIYVTGKAEGGYHAWNYVYLEEDNKWYASDITFSDGGEEVFLRGNGILSTHIPFEEGIAEGGFGYLLPELSEENYVFEQAKIEEPNEKIENEENNNDYGLREEVSIFEENTNGKTYISDMGILLPINPDVKSWVEIGTYMRESDVNTNERNTKLWGGLSIPKDTMYTWFGEAYINGMSADLFYTVEAQKSHNTSIKIANYKEACKYNSSDAGLYFNIAYYYSLEGNYEDAFSYYLKAIERGDNGAVDNILFLIERYKSETERTAEYQKVLSVVPDDKRVLDRLLY